MVDDIQVSVRERIETAIHDQWCSAAAVMVLHRGRILARHGEGWLATHQATPDDPGTTGARVENPVAADAQTWFDLASVTKTISAVTLLTLVEHGDLDLDAPIGHHLAPFATGDRSRVTLRMLLTHTSGLPPTWSGWFHPLDRVRQAGIVEPLQQWPPQAPGRADLLEDLLASPLQNAPGTAWDYSCVGFNTAMALAETITGTGWGDLVTDLVLGPMGLSDGIAFVPAGPAAATEYQPEFGRGVVQGIVHDETAWSLGAVCANAGLFATVDGLAGFTEALRTDELPCSNEPLLTNALPAILGRDVADQDTAPWGHGLGLRLGQDWLGDPHAAGHAGFTGTGIMVNPELELSVVVLANRVHPRRSETQVQRLREEICAAATQFVRADRD